jgi:hypothetical protein
MPWYAYLIHFAGGLVLTNGLPHFLHGMSGDRFQSPFADPPGKGLSSPTINVVWGFANLVAGYVLIVVYAPMNNGVRDDLDIAAIALGVLTAGLFLSAHFGKVKGNL